MSLKHLIKRAKGLLTELDNDDLAVWYGWATQSSRTINKTIVHCLDSDVPIHDRFMDYFLYKWHVEENKWLDYGYHFGIKKNGKVIRLRPVSKPGAHCKGHNKDSIGIVLSGKTQFTDEQFTSLRKLTTQINKAYNLTIKDVYPHSLFSNKTCPNFDLRKALEYV